VSLTTVVNYFFQSWATLQESLGLALRTFFGYESSGWNSNYDCDRNDCSLSWATLQESLGLALRTFFGYESSYKDSLSDLRINALRRFPKGIVPSLDSKVSKWIAVRKTLCFVLSKFPKGIVPSLDSKVSKWIAIREFSLLTYLCDGFRPRKRGS
jgi:hypothetical protein